MNTFLKPLSVLACLALAISCSSPRPDFSALAARSSVETTPADYHPEATQILADFRAAGKAVNASGYRIAAGDDISISVFGREELSGSHRVGPDGYISLPVVGDVLVGGLSRDQARSAVNTAIATAYSGLSATVGIDTYTAYSVVVLGGVVSPGEYRFDAVPTLLRAIGSADGLLVDSHGLKPEQCAIMRGSESILWIDLNELLAEGDMSLNVELIPGDIVHVTADSQRLIYVLGEVGSPGIYPLRRGMTALDAIALAGGITVDADDDGLLVLRPSEDSVDGFDYEEFTEGDFLQNQFLAKGDVVFAPRHTLAEIGWVFQKLQPIAQLGILYGIVTNN